MAMTTWLRILLIFSTISAWGQTFENIRTSKEGDKIIIIYDLISLDPGSQVTVQVFSSKDSYKLPLKNVTGDIGTVMPGPNKRITWLAGEEIANEVDQIKFTFKSESFAGWSFIGTTPKVMRRGKKNTLEWQGGKGGDEVTIQLLKPDMQVEEIAMTLNSGSYRWNTPRKLKPRDGYAIRITSMGNSIEHRFSIKRKIPVLYYVGLTGVGVAAALINLTGGSAGSSDLPDAPIPN
ncbi:MAG: hypothetical protein RI909_471 [Bacteroidota bacterium]|jgi:hypothetical protein